MEHTKLISARCVVCGSEKMNLLLDVPEVNFSKNITRFNIVRCENCSLSQMDPFPKREDIQEIYVTENVFSKDITDKTNTKRFGASFFEPAYRKYGNYYYYIAKKCLGLSSKKVSELRILDVGCSTGRLLSEFYQLAPQADIQGIEIDPDSKNKAFPEIKEKITIGNFLNHSFVGKFDIITFCFVVEHLPDVDAYIKNAESLLNEGGVLFFSSPDIDSRKARQLKSKWRLINDPINKLGHVIWFNKRSAHYLANKYDLEVVHYKNRGEFLYQLPLFLQRIIKFIFGTVTSPNGETRVIRNYQLRMSYALLFDSLLPEIFGWGDCFYLFSRKRSI